MRTVLLVMSLVVLAGSPNANQAPARWDVDPAPVLDIAGTSDNGDVAFGTANWATRLPDGGVVVADAAAPGLRFFDGSGRFVRQAGREGAGPSEFRTVTWVGRCGPGRVYAWDWIQRRLVQFDASGAYRNTIAVSATPVPYTVACSPSGAFAFLGIPQRREMKGSDAGTTATVVSGASPLVFADSSGTARLTLGDYPVGELVAGAGAEGMRPLGRWTAIAFGPDRFHVGTAESPSVDMFDARGKRLGSFAVPVTPRAPTKAMQEAAINDLVLAVPRRFRDVARAQMRNVPLPERLPPYRQVVVDPLGIVWVVVTESGDPETRLLAFDGFGRHIGVAVVPNGLRVFEVGRDYVLGAREDQDGEQHVQVWRLRRPSR